MNQKSYQGSQTEAGGCDWKIIEVLKWKVIPGVQNRGISLRRRRVNEWMSTASHTCTHPLSSWHYNYPDLNFQYSTTISKTSLSLTHCTIKGLFVSLENLLKARRQRSTSLCKVHNYTLFSLSRVHRLRNHCFYFNFSETNVCENECKKCHCWECKTLSAKSTSCSLTTDSGTL